MPNDAATSSAHEVFLNLLAEDHRGINPGFAKAGIPLYEKLGSSFSYTGVPVCPFTTSACLFLNGKTHETL